MTDRADPQDCPYVGLDPFEKTYEEFFFGREQDSRVLADHVMYRRVCTAASTQLSRYNEWARRRGS